MTARILSPEEIAALAKGASRPMFAAASDLAATALAALSVARRLDEGWRTAAGVWSWSGAHPQKMSPAEAAVLALIREEPEDD